MMETTQMLCWGKRGKRDARLAGAQKTEVLNGDNDKVEWNHKDTEYTGFIVLIYKNNILENNLQNQSRHKNVKSNMQELRPFFFFLPIQKWDTHSGNDAQRLWHTVVWTHAASQFPVTPTKLLLQTLTYNNII